MNQAKSVMSQGGRARHWIMRGLRVSAAASFVLLAFSAVTVHVGLARASDVGMSIGDQLLLVGGEGNSTGAVAPGVSRVHFNSQILQSTNTSTTMPMRDVLNYVADQCKHHSNGLRDGFEHMNGVSGALVVHKEFGERGFVFCVAPDHELDMTELMRRLRLATHSGDFSDVGNIRYVAVRQFDGHARVVTVWNDGPFEFGNMFPEDGDAPGEDFGGVPRPDGARRTLSATIEGAPAGVNTYLVKGAPAEVLTGLDAKLVGAGWKTVPTAKGVPNAGKYYTLGSKEDLVVTATNATDGMTNVGYVVSRAVASVSR